MSKWEGRDFDPDKLLSELESSDLLLEKLVPKEIPAVPLPPPQQEPVKPEPVIEGAAAQQPQRRKREFQGRIAHMRKEAQKGRLPTTEDLESIILAIALRTVNSADAKRSKEGMDLLLQVYGKRTTAKHAPGNQPKKTGAQDESL